MKETIYEIVDLELIYCYNYNFFIYLKNILPNFIIIQFYYYKILYITIKKLDLSKSNFFKESQNELFNIKDLNF